VGISANSLLDIQLLTGIILILFGIKPPGIHLLLVGAATVLAHYSYSMEKRQGSSINTLTAAWIAVAPVSIVLW